LSHNPEEDRQRQRRADDVEERGEDQVDPDATEAPGTPTAKRPDVPADTSDEKTTSGGDPRRETAVEKPEGDTAAAVPEEPGLPPQHPTREGMFGADGTGDTSGYGRLKVRETNPVRLGSTPHPWPDELEAIGETTESALEQAGIVFDEAIEKVVADRGELTFFVRREHLQRVARVFRDDPSLRYEVCQGVSGVHYPGETGRELHACFPLLSMTHNRRVRLEVVCPDDDPHMPSVTHIWPANNWHERETYDFFGIVFDDHPALTRIEMPDDWPGHPQRKDYPLGGIPVEYKGATIPAPDHRRAYS